MALNGSRKPAQGQTWPFDSATFRRWQERGRGALAALNTALPPEGRVRILLLPPVAW